MYRDNTARKIEDIQYQLALGKTRPEIAKALGFTDVTGLYHFASRHKLVWNADKKNYDATGNDGNPIKAVKPSANVPTGKVANIISMFERGMDGREIVKKLRFTSYKDMADFMKSKGYIWNEGKSNYELQPQEIIEAVEAKRFKDDIPKAAATNSCNCLEKYGGLLDILAGNMDKLADLLNDDCGVSSSLPRYILAGATITKSIKINDTLDRLINDYSTENNITQKELIQMAVIEFFRKHGYNDMLKIHLKI